MFQLHHFNELRGYMPSHFLCKLQLGRQETFGNYRQTSFLTSQVGTEMYVIALYEMIVHYCLPWLDLHKAMVI